jgi:hypothetical protein
MTSNDQLLLSILETEIGSSPASAALVVNKGGYRRIVSLRNVTTYSTQQHLHDCPRKFQLEKLDADCNFEEEENTSVDFAFGHAVGAGVAVYDQTQDRDKTIFAALLAWNVDLFAERRKEEGKTDKKKSFPLVIWALFGYETFFHEETDLGEYEVVQIEARIGIDFENGHYYTGHIDEVLKHKDSGQLKIKENKTTGLLTVDPAMYGNSDQALSYSLTVEAAGETDYSVMYTVYSCSAMQWLHFEFVKSTLNKANWLQDQIFIHSTLDMYSEFNLFPKRGSACLKFGYRCKYYESCDFDTVKIFSKRFSDLDAVQSLEELEERIGKIDYKFTWSQVVSAQTK